MDNYTIPEGGLEVLLLALQVFEKYGRKYPSIVTDEHFYLASKMARDLLLVGVDNDKSKNNGA